MKKKIINSAIIFVSIFITFQNIYSDNDNNNSEHLINNTIIDQNIDKDNEYKANIINKSSDNYQNSKNLNTQENYQYTDPYQKKDATIEENGNKSTDDNLYKKNDRNTEVISNAKEEENNSKEDIQENTEHKNTIFQDKELLNNNDQNQEHETIELAVPPVN